MAATSPQVPVVNAGELYINGLHISQNSLNPEQHLNVTRGAARNSSNVNDIVLQNDLIVKIDRRGANGLDSGTLQDERLYAVFIIGSSIGLIGNGQENTKYPTAGLLSLSFDRPTMPFGYDMFRRIGTIAIDSVGEIQPFQQVGNSVNRDMLYGGSFPVLTSGNATDYTDVFLNQGNECVPDLATNVYLLVTYVADNVNNVFRLRPSGSDAAYFYLGNVQIVGTGVLMYATCPCNNSAFISYEIDDDAVGNSLSISVVGFKDLL